MHQMILQNPGWRHLGMVDIRTIYGDIWGMVYYGYTQKMWVNLVAILVIIPIYYIGEALAPVFPTER